MVFGVTVFILFGASHKDNVAAGCVAVIGMIVAYIGYRLEEE